MVKIEDKHAELVEGIFKITLKDDSEFELKPTEGQKGKLMFNYKLVQELSARYEKLLKDNKLTEDFLETHDKKSTKLHAEQNAVIKEIVKDSYPTQSAEFISAIMVRYDNELLIELYMAFGWVNKDALEALEKARLEEIKKLVGEEKTPDQKLKKNEQEKSEQT